MHTCVCLICLRSFVPACMHTCMCVYVQCACMDMFVSDRHNRHVCLLCMVYFKEGEGCFFGVFMGVYVRACVHVCVCVCMCVCLCVCACTHIFMCVHYIF